MPKKISTSWILSRSIGRICRMDIFYYYIRSLSNIPLTMFFCWTQYEDFIFLCFISFAFNNWRLFNQGWKHYARLTDFSIFLRLTLYMKTIFFELHIRILYREHIIKKKNIKNILSNRKSKTKISKINPSDRLISQKITVQSTLYEAIAYTWGTSNNLGFHQHPCSFSCSKCLSMCF